MNFFKKCLLFLLSFFFISGSTVLYQYHVAESSYITYFREKYGLICNKSSRGIYIVFTANNRKNQLINVLNYKIKCESIKIEKDRIILNFRPASTFPRQQSTKVSSVSFNFFYTKPKNA